MSAPILKLLAAAPVASVSCDAELLTRFVRTRDEAAFADLVRRHGPLVYRFCSRLVGPNLADDAFQAVFLVLACRAGQLRKPESVGSWLIGVAGRVARQLRARETLRKSRELPDLVDPSRAPDAHLICKELAQSLDHELTRLPDNLRDALVLCLLQGRTQGEAAAEIGWSIRTVRRRLDRAKALLRLRLERRGVVPAVATGLLSGGMAGARAVPVELIRETVTAIVDFHNGAITDAAPAVIAKGVVANMVATKHWTAVVCVVTLGLVWAATAQTGTQLSVPSDGSGLVSHPMASDAQSPEPASERLKELPPASHRSANFVVHAPTPMLGAGGRG